MCVPSILSHQAGIPSLNHHSDNLSSSVLSLTMRPFPASSMLLLLQTPEKLPNTERLSSSPLTDIGTGGMTKASLVIRNYQTLSKHCLL